MSEGRTKAKVSGLRLSEQELSAIAQARRTHNGAEKRKHRRLPLADSFTLLVRLERTGGNTVFSVVPRDLGAEGVGFFHTSYVHPGTAATFLMRNRLGESVAVAGVVKWCHHVSGRVHEVGALFEQVLRVEVFVEVPEKGGEPHELSPAEVLCDRIAALADELKSLATTGAALETIGAKVAELTAAMAPAPTAAGAPGP